MKRITAKVITISSQILVVSLFLLLVFNGKGSNDKVTVVNNNNFYKMADSTSILFKEEELMVSQIDDSVVEVLGEDTKKESLKEEIISEKEESSEKQEGSSKKEQKKEDKEQSNNVSKLDNVLETYTGILTGYGPDCVGCGNYKTKKVKTASGYHIANIVDNAVEPAFTITYDDKEYGEVRIVAADSDIPFYSIVRITIPNKDPIMAIVLDRGSTVGFEGCRSNKGCLTNFDLLFPSESEAIGKTKNVKFELLRSGK